MNRFFSWFSFLFLKPIVDWLLIKKVNGLENIPKRNFILVSNHTSYLDIIVDSYLCVPRKFHFIGQIDGWKGIMRLLMRAFYFLFGVIPLDRTNQRSKENVIKKAIEVLKKGNILILYPEGRRSLTGKIQEGKLGAAKIFLKTGVPILPAGLKGVFELAPPRGKFKIKRIVEINVGKPLSFNEEFRVAQNLSEDSPEYQKILEKITEKIMAELTRLSS